jgi:hypothetical protein
MFAGISSMRIPLGMGAGGEPPCDEHAREMKINMMRNGLMAFMRHTPVQQEVIVSLYVTTTARGKSCRTIHLDLERMFW